MARMLSLFTFKISILEKSFTTEMRGREGALFRVTDVREDADRLARAAGCRAGSKKL